MGKQTIIEEEVFVGRSIRLATALPSDLRGPAAGGPDAMGTKSEIVTRSSSLPQLDVPVLALDRVADVSPIIGLAAKTVVRDSRASFISELGRGETLFLSSYRAIAGRSVSRSVHPRLPWQSTYN